MINAEIMIVGAGPAGLNAALAAASSGAKVLLCDKGKTLGGKLTSQTQILSNDTEYAGLRGYAIAEKLRKEVLNNSNIEVWQGAIVLGYYEDDVVTVLYNRRHIKVKPQRLVIATGAIDNYMAFANNDLPGIISARTARILINKYGILPAERAIVIGSDDTALFTANDLIQAGACVEVIVSADDKVKDHLDVIENSTVSMKMGYTILKAIGDERVTGAVICKVDRHGNVVAGTEETIECDVICISAGLTPLVDLCALAECKMTYVYELSGYVPETDENMKTTRKEIYAVGNCCKVEDSVAALIEGKIAGYDAASSLGLDKINMIGKRNEAKKQLALYRDRPKSALICAGLKQFSIRCKA